MKWRRAGRTRARVGGWVDEEGASQIIQWLNSTTLFFLQNPPKWKKIYIHNIKKQEKKKKTIVSSSAEYHVGLCDPPLVHADMVRKSV